MSIDQLHEANWNKVGLEFEQLKEGTNSATNLSLQTSNGGKVPIEVHARRVEFEETDSLQWIMRDITARKELDALRDDMTAMIYHDLRSPLGNIISSLDMMKDMARKDDAIQCHGDDRGQLHCAHSAPRQFPARYQPP